MPSFFLTVLQRDSRRRLSFHNSTNAGVHPCNCATVRLSHWVFWGVFFFLPCNCHVCSSQVNTALVDLATLPSHGDGSKEWKGEELHCFSEASLLGKVY